MIEEWARDNSNERHRIFLLRLFLSIIINKRKKKRTIEKE
jgi:hypothetical protein